MKEKGLRVNVAKTKVLRCHKKSGQVEESGKHPCGVCKRGVGSNSILCGICGKWVHRKCSGLKGTLKNNSDFKCAVCIGRQQDKVSEKRELVLEVDSTLEADDRFCYLGDVIEAGG